MTNKEKARKLFALADVELNGNRPWDIQVHDERFFNCIFSQGRLGIGESYVDGWWDVKELDQFMDRVFAVGLNKKIVTLGLLLHVLKAKLINFQNSRHAFRIGKEHYDAGNDLYKAMLDKRMVYTCGYWREARTLDEAQEAKLDLVCKKIGLKKGQRVLDIGGGWGSFGKYAAEHYGAKVVAVTVSKKQVEFGRELVKGLPVEIRLQDYRDVDDGPYDHVVSLGMFEHVGYKNYQTYIKAVHRCLSDDGLFLLHTIGNSRSVYTGDPWINKYIFPGGMLPSIAQLGRSIENIFTMEDWHNFGADYDKTLMTWFTNFDRNWDKLKADYNEEFYRIWKYYLLSTAGAFRSRKHIQLWQIVLSKRGVPGGYQSIR